MHQPNLSRSLKFCCGRICPSALATVCKQPFLLPHQYATGNVQHAALFSKTSSSNHAVFFTLLYVLSQPVQPCVTVFWHGTLLLHHQHTTINWRWISIEETFQTNKQYHTTNAFIGPRFQYHSHCTSTYAPNSIWLTLVQSVAWYPYYKCYLLTYSMEQSPSW
jgi:hypothetical protein